MAPGWFGFLWICGAEALGLALNMPFLCHITFWELFVEGFDVEPWPGIIISCSNGVVTCFFIGESFGCMIIYNCLIGGWQFEYMGDGFFGR